MKAMTGALTVACLLGVAPVAAQEASASPLVAASPAIAGTSPVLVPSAGFIVSLPDDWLVLELGDDPGTAATQFALAHPELEDLLRDFLAMGPMAMLAFAPITDDDPFPATFTSFQGPNMGMSAQQMLDFTVQGLPQLPGVTGEIDAELLTIGGQPGLAVGYDWELAHTAGGTTPVRVEQFTVVTPGTVWAFSVTDDDADPDAWREMAASFELLP